MGLNMRAMCPLIKWDVTSLNYTLPNLAFPEIMGTEFYPPKALFPILFSIISSEGISWV